MIYLCVFAIKKFNLKYFKIKLKKCYHNSFFYLATFKKICFKRMVINVNWLKHIRVISATKEISIVKVTVTLYADLIMAQYSPVFSFIVINRQEINVPYTLNHRAHLFFAFTLYLPLHFPQQFPFRFITTDARWMSVYLTRIK